MERPKHRKRERLRRPPLLRKNSCSSSIALCSNWASTRRASASFVAWNYFAWPIIPLPCNNISSRRSPRPRDSALHPVLQFNPFPPRWPQVLLILRHTCRRRLNSRTQPPPDLTSAFRHNPYPQLT